MRPSGARPPGDGENSPHDGYIGPWAPLTDLVVPDDARELDADLRAWRREERWRRGRERLRLSGGSRVGIAVPVALLVLLAVSLLVSFTAGFNALLGPNADRRPALPQPLPLAASDIPTGQPGALLPAADVAVAGKLISARNLRPAVVLLVPPNCDCDTQLREVVGQSQVYRLPVYLAGQPNQRASLSALAAGAGQAIPTVVDDVDGVFADTYHPSGLTAVLVTADGLAQHVVTGIKPGTHLEAQLRPLVTAGATPAIRAETAPIR